MRFWALLRVSAASGGSAILTKTLHLNMSLASLRNVMNLVFPVNDADFLRLGTCDVARWTELSHWTQEVKLWPSKSSSLWIQSSDI